MIEVIADDWKIGWKFAVISVPVIALRVLRPGPFPDGL